MKTDINYPKLLEYARDDLAGIKAQTEEIYDIIGKALEELRRMKDDSKSDAYEKTEERLMKVKAYLNGIYMKAGIRIKRTDALTY